MSHNDENSNPFAGAPVIFSYSRAQAIEDGVLADVTEPAKEAGFKFPVAITSLVFDSVVDTPEIAEKQGESNSGRLWDVLWMCASASRRLDNTDTVYFRVIATDQDGKKVEHQLYALCGPGDTAAPVITIMMVGED